MSEETIPVEQEVKAESETAQNTVESATAETEVKQEPTPEDQPKETEEKPKPGKNSFERKIDRLYKAAAEQRARADFFEKQLEELKPKAKSSEGAPRLEDFSDIEEYANAKAKYEAANILKNGMEQQRANASRQQLLSIENAWEEKASRADGKYDDFDDVVGELKPVNPLTIAIMQAENAEDVAYYLGKNLKEAQRIAALDQIAQIREVGRLEAKLMSEPPKPKMPSQAPAPIKPVSGKSSATTGEPLDSDDYATWLKKRNKQVHG